jgi:uncharacterized membrane protein
LDRAISRKRRLFLADESRSWVERGLISETQRDGILESYTLTRPFPAAVLALGIAMIGLGVLSFIAANWNVLPKGVKIALIAGSYLTSVAGAYLCERRGWRLVSDTLLFLSGFLLLGGLALISQIFHIKGSPADLLATWLLIYGPTFLLTRGLAIYALYEVTALVYINLLYAARAWGYRGVRGIFSVVTPHQPLVLLVLLVAAAWWSRFLTRNSDSAPRSIFKSIFKEVFVGGSTRKIFLSNFFILNWFTWLCVINSTHESVLPFVTGILAIGILISFSAWKLDAADLDLQGLLCVGLAGFALTFRFVWEGRYYYDDYAGTSELLFRQILSSAVLGAYLLWRIVRQNRNTAFAAFLFCAVLARWYFDMFYNFMSKSLFFTVGGVLLLLIAFACHRWNGKKAAANASGPEKSEQSGGGGDARVL